MDVHLLLIAVNGSGIFDASTGAVGGTVAKPPYDAWLKTLLQALIFLANLAGGVVVGVGVLRGLVLFLVDLIANAGGETPKEAIRLSLGRSLALALEFQLGADILGTALDPSARDLVILAAIVVLRTVLNFFLARELADAERRGRRAAAPTESQDRSTKPR